MARLEELTKGAVVRGVLGDRRFAIKRKVSQPDVWAAKVHFRVCMNTPVMAAQTPVFADAAPASASHTGPIDSGRVAKQRLAGC